MQHGVCRIELCCLVYFSAIVKNQSLKKKKRIGFMILYVALFCCYGQLRFLSSVWSNIITRLACSHEKSAPQGRAIKKSTPE